MPAWLRIMVWCAAHRLSDRAILSCRPSGPFYLPQGLQPATETGLPFSIVPRYCPGLRVACGADVSPSTENVTANIA